jgi:hypothetical protein
MRGLRRGNTPPGAETQPAAPDTGPTFPLGQEPTTGERSD